MSRTATAGASVLVVASVLGLAFVMSGLLFTPARTGPHPAAIVIWLVFGGGVTTAGRLVPRATALAAAGLLAVVALVDLILPVLNVSGSQDFGWISASAYTWLAIAIMAANGLAPVLSGRGQADPEAGPST